MPHAIKTDEKYRKKGLRTIFVHVQHDPVDLQRFALNRYPHIEAMVTADCPIAIGDTENLRLPMAALIGCDGKILAVGHRNDVGAKIDKLIPKEIKKHQSGWGATPEISKARSLMHAKLRLTDAKKILDGYQPSNDIVKKDLELARRELELRFQSDINSVQHLMERGNWIPAKKLFDRIDRGCANNPAWKKKCDLVRAKFSDYVGKDEMKLAKKTAKIYKEARKGIKDGMAAKMRKAIAGKKGLKVYNRGMYYASIWDRLAN